MLLRRVKENSEEFFNHEFKNLYLNQQKKVSEQHENLYEWTETM